MKKISIIGKKWTFSLMCLLMVLILTSCAKSDAFKEFNSLTSEIKQQQNDLTNKIAESETLLYETKGKDITDPNLLERLRNEIDSAKKFSVTIPVVGSDATAIKQQIQDLITKQSELQKQSNSLNDAISAINVSKQKLIDQIAAEKEAKLQEAITPKDSHLIIVTDEKGNKEKITITIGKWIKGSENLLLDKAWKTVGGNGPMPLIGKYSRKAAMLTDATFTPNDAAYVFGTVSIENATPNFNAKNFGNGNSWVYVSLKIPFDGMFTDWRPVDFEVGDVVQGIQFSSGTDCEIMYQNQFVRADMVSNQWGPIPFVIGADTVFSPKYPNGNPAMDNINFFLSGNFGMKLEGDSRFKIGKSW